MTIAESKYATPEAILRPAERRDLDELLRLEDLSFDADRLSRRSFKRWLRHGDCVFEVLATPRGLLGYILVVLRRGTRLARLYSLAVDPAARGGGIASLLIEQGEARAREEGALYMRLEVATGNAPAIALYRKLGYEPFGLYRDYYEDHDDAVRMEKCIHLLAEPGRSRIIPWISQTTNFTCGPAALMMAMAALGRDYEPSPVDELQIWREATTIFMTSGHGGCHPVGLALSAVRRGFDAEVWVNQRGALFLEGVRDTNKRRVMSLAHDAFVAEAKARGVHVRYGKLDQQQLVDRFEQGANVLILISTYRLDQKKVPHWVVLSGVDANCLYVQDPDMMADTSSDVAREGRLPMDCQHLPIAREDFAAMSRFGGNRLQTAVILRQPRLDQPAPPGRRREDHA